MQDEFLVHTREGEECPRCGAEIRRIVVGGRSTYFCPGCQTRLRRRAQARSEAVSEPPPPPGGLPDRPLERPGGADRLHGRDRPGGHAGRGGRARRAGPGRARRTWSSPFAGTDRVSAVTFAGGSAYGLAGRRRRDAAGSRSTGSGYPTPAGLVPIVPAAIVYDLAEGDPQRAGRRRRGPRGVRGGERGRARARAGGRRVGDRGEQDPRPRAGGARPASATRRRGAGGITVAALAVANPFGDIVGDGWRAAGDGPLGGRRACADGRGDRRDGGAARTRSRRSPATRRSCA